MIAKFEKAMAKLAVVGHIPQALVDCSEVIPIPSTAKSQVAVFPAGKSNKDVAGAVRSSLTVLNDHPADSRVVCCYSLPHVVDHSW